MEPRPDLTIVLIAIGLTLLSTFKLIQSRLSPRTCGNTRQLQQWSSLGIRMLQESHHALRAGRYLELSQQRFRHSGSTFGFHQLGTRQILTIEPENVKALLATQFYDFGVGAGRQIHFEPYIGPGIFTADGDIWKELRKRTRSCFQNRLLTSVEPFEEHFQRLRQSISGSAEPVDLQSLFSTLTINIATQLLFGKSTTVVQDQNAENGKRFANAFNRSQRAIVNSTVLGRLSTWIPVSNQARRDRNEMRNFVAPYVEKAWENKHSSDSLETLYGYDFISQLARSTESKKALSGNLLNLLLAGRDTTTSLLGSLFFVLARRPDVYARLWNETSCLLQESTRPPTLEQLHEMPFLKACIDECLRMYPPIPRNSRTALRDTTLPTGGGPDGHSPVFVPKGTQVGYHVWSMHRRQDIFGDDADVFNPERWLQKDFRPGFAFLPFNAGPRICLGQQFALNQVRYITVRLIQHFQSIKALDDRPWVEDLGLSCSVRGGVLVTLQRRAAGTGKDRKLMS